MKYQVTIKEIPEMTVYYSEKRLAKIEDKMTFIPACGEEAKKLNPQLKCAEPAYEFVEYLDDSYRETDVLIRHSEAVTEFGTENENIKFRKVPAAKVLSIFHKGAYEKIGEAYAFIIFVHHALPFQQSVCNYQLYKDPLNILLLQLYKRIFLFRD